MTPTRPSLPAGMTIAAIFAGQSLGMAGIVSFPALLPQFRQLWSLSGREAGPLAAAVITWIALPPLSRAAAQVSSWLPPLGSIFRNRRTLVFICAYGLHNGEVSAIRAWLVPCWSLQPIGPGAVGAGSEAAWIAAFAVQAIIGAAWPFAYLRNRVRRRRAMPPGAG